MLSSAVAAINGSLPKFARPVAYTLLFNSQIKLAWTCGLRITEISADRAAVQLKNRMRIRNHIGGIHACAIALAAESASGCVFGMNLSKAQLPLLKSMAIDYKRMSKGDLLAVATLTTEQRELIRTQQKGEVSVAVTVTDSKMPSAPVECTMIWAWITKK